MSNKENKAVKRSSLKMNSHFTQQEIISIQQKNKRNSVSWASAIPSAHNFKEIKTSFGMIEEEKDPENKAKSKDANKQFESARRESTKNEFTLALKYFKDKNIESLETEEEDFEEIRKNTMKNKVILKEDSDNNSDDSKSSDNEAEV